MGEEFIRLNGKELSLLTVMCPYCGIGLQIDLTKLPATQLRGGTCTCGEPLPRKIKDLVASYKMAWDLLNEQDCEARFDVKVK